MLDRYQRNIVYCSLCGNEIARGEQLGFSSALCAQCSEEQFPQFKKEDNAPVDTPIILPRPLPIPEPFVTEDTESQRSSPVSVYEEPKKKKPPKSKGKSVDKVIKSLRRVKQ